MNKREKGWWDLLSSAVLLIGNAVYKEGIRVKGCGDTQKMARARRHSFTGLKERGWLVLSSKVMDQ